MGQILRPPCFTTETGINEDPKNASEVGFAKVGCTDVDLFFDKCK